MTGVLVFAKSIDQAQSFISAARAGPDLNLIHSSHTDMLAACLVDRSRRLCQNQEDVFDALHMQCHRGKDVEESGE